MIGGTIVCGLIMVVRTSDLRWLVLSLPFSVLLLIGARYAPRGYRLAADGIHVERQAGPKVIPYGVIRAVDREPRSLTGMSFGGFNGLFGRFGRFWNPRLGVYRLFLSNTHSVVWLATNDGWVALSPEPPDEFCAHLEARLSDRLRSS